jgi:hypothetical protein
MAGRQGYGPRHIDRTRPTFPVMLSIGKLGAGQERYYTEKITEGSEGLLLGQRRGGGLLAGRRLP